MTSGTLCLDFFQFDAFSKIHGGSSGRDVGGDGRIELNEWLEGYKGVMDHGFVAFQDISTKGDAAELFRKMDDSDGGVVLLDECVFFCQEMRGVCWHANGQAFELCRRWRSREEETIV